MVVPGRHLLHRLRVERPLQLLAGCVAAIAALTALNLADAPAALSLPLQAAFVLGFAWLCAVDLRTAVGLLIFELAIAGAGGRWTSLGPVSGRNLMLVVVLAASAIVIARRRRRTGRASLGRYGPHAIALAVGIPALWMTQGLLEGHAPSDVIGDGNGVACFALAVPLTILVQAGHGAWIRRCLLAACAANAAAVAVVIALTASRVLELGSTVNSALLGDLDLGGAVGYGADGAYRLYLGSGLYFQVGIALTCWALLRDPRSRALWLLFLVLWVDVLASYTRGYWAASILSAAIVLVLGAWSVRAVTRVLAPAALAAVALVAVALAAGLAIPQSVVDSAKRLAGDEPRVAATIGLAPPISTEGTRTPGQPGLWRGSPPVQRATLPAGRTPGSGRPAGLPAVATPATEGRTSGAVSDQIRRVQARVLWGHIRDRPMFGHGFGAIAEDYPFARTYSYELAYLDIGFKTGVAGLLLFLSLPLRLLLDALKGRFGRGALPAGMDRHELAVVVAIVTGVLALGATNPYLLAAFGLFPIVCAVAWLEPGLERPGAGVEREQPQHGGLATEVHAQQ